MKTKLSNQTSDKKLTEKEQWKKGRVKDIKVMIKMYREQIKKLKNELKWLQEE